MDIYFAASISGGRKFEKTYVQIVSILKQKGHRVLTEHIAYPNVLEAEEALTPEQIFARDLKWLTAADVVIAEVSNPSLGVGYEIARALEMKKPVLCVYRRNIFLTKMITGNKDGHLTVQDYSTWAELASVLQTYLNERN